MKGKEGTKAYAGERLGGNLREADTSSDRGGRNEIKVITKKILERKELTLENLQLNFSQRVESMMKASATTDVSSSWSLSIMMVTIPLRVSSHIWVLLAVMRF